MCACVYEAACTRAPSRCAVQALAVKYETRTDSLFRVVVKFLKTEIRKHGLKDPAIVLYESKATTYSGTIRLDVDRLRREGLLTWAAFAAAYLRRGSYSAPSTTPTTAPS